MAPVDGNANLQSTACSWQIRLDDVQSPVNRGYSSKQTKKTTKALIFLFISEKLHYAFFLAIFSGLPNKRFPTGFKVGRDLTHYRNLDNMLNLYDLMQQHSG